MGCFYDKGLKFSCQGCSYCCSSEPGYVFLSQDDLTRMSEGLGLSEDEFIRIYCRKVDMGAFEMISLLEKDNYDCIFLTENGCKAYPFRPLQCSTYPFWAHILESREDWENEAKSCPGINKGQLHSKKEIEACLDSRRRAEPIVILK